jgi:hypothetical protein
MCSCFGNLARLLMPTWGKFGIYVKNGHSGAGNPEPQRPAETPWRVASAGHDAFGKTAKEQFMTAARTTKPYVLYTFYNVVQLRTDLVVAPDGK